MTSLRDRDGEIWTPDGDDTYGCLDGTFTGWRRQDIEAQYGPVVEIAEMTEYVTFVAPVDWREQLDGADPIRLFETWIVPPASGPIRQGGKVRRHLYIGPFEADEIAVTVGSVPEARAWAEFLRDAGNAWHTAGHPMPGEEPTSEEMAAAAEQASQWCAWPLEGLSICTRIATTVDHRCSPAHEAFEEKS